MAKVQRNISFYRVLVNYIRRPLEGFTVCCPNNLMTSANIIHRFPNPLIHIRKSGRLKKHSCGTPLDISPTWWTSSDSYPEWSTFHDLCYSVLHLSMHHVQFRSGPVWSGHRARGFGQRDPSFVLGRAVITHHIWTLEEFCYSRSNAVQFRRALWGWSPYYEDP